MPRLALLALACLAVLPAVEAPAPAAMPDAQSFLVAVVPDLRSTITHVEAAATALGAPLPPGMLAQQLGGTIGDPQLASLGQGPLVVVVAPGVPLPRWAAIIPSTKPELITTAVTRMGLASEAVGNQVVVAQTIDGVEIGKALVPQIAALTPAAPAPDLRLVVASDRVATAYLPFLLGALQSLPQKPGSGMPDPKQLAAIGAILRVFAAETGTVQLDLALSADGLRIDTVAAPHASGVLAKGLIAPAPAGAKPLIGRFGQSDGYLTVAGRTNPAATAAFADLLAKVAADPQAAAMITPELATLAKDMAGVFTGEFAMHQGIGGKPVAQEVVYGITSAERAVAFADRARQLMSAGPLADLYAGMGMTFKLEPAVRKGPGGERIDRFSIVVDQAKAPPGVGEMWAKMFVPNEIGFGAGVAVVAGDPKALDLLLGAGRGPCALAAEKTIGPGWDGYVDYDIGLQMRAQASMLEGTPGAAAGAAFFADMPIGHPLASAWAVRDGRIRARFDVPMALAKDMKDHFAKQRMQHRQNRRQDGASGAPPAEGRPQAPPALF